MISIKMKHLFFVCMGLLLALAVVGCDTDSDSEMNVLLTRNTWRCEGLVSSSDNTLTPIHPDEKIWQSPNSYTISFNSDGSFKAHSGGNDIWGDYSLSSGNQIAFHLRLQTLVKLFGEIIDYEKVLLEEVTYYEVTNDELRLYFNNKQQYLLYKHTDISLGD